MEGSLKVCQVSDFYVGYLFLFPFSTLCGEFMADTSGYCVFFQLWSSHYFLNFVISAVQISLKYTSICTYKAKDKLATFRFYGGIWRWWSIGRIGVEESGCVWKGRKTCGYGKEEKRSGKKSFLCVFLNLFSIVIYIQY